MLQSLKCVLLTWQTDITCSVSAKSTPPVHCGPFWSRCQVKNRSSDHKNKIFIYNNYNMFLWLSMIPYVYTLFCKHSPLGAPGSIVHWVPLTTINFPPGSPNQCNILHVNISYGFYLDLSYGSTQYHSFRQSGCLWMGQASAVDSGSWSHCLRLMSVSPTRLTHIQNPPQKSLLCLPVLMSGAGGGGAGWVRVFL